MVYVVTEACVVAQHESCMQECPADWAGTIDYDVDAVLALAPRGGE